MRTALLLAIFFTGCSSRHAGETYSTVDGAKFEISEHYQYLGNGKFKHVEIVKWEDLK